MFSVLIGIALVLVAAFLWVGNISVAHALAIFTGLIGIALALYGTGDRGAKYTRL